MTAHSDRPPLLADASDARPDDDPLYEACRDHSGKRYARDEMSALWASCGELLPEKAETFVAEFRRNFHARAWELYVLDWLRAAGVTLVRSPSFAPDFCGTHPTVGRFWVECVVPNHGQGPDAVRVRPDDVRVWCGGPDAPVALRYAHALDKKFRRIADYRSAGVIAPSEPVIVALNQCGIQDSEDHDVELPLMARVLYGISQPTLVYSPYGDARDRIVSPPQVSVRKRNEAEVSTVLFEHAESSGVAAVALAVDTAFNLFGLRRGWLRLFHNPNAVAAFPVGALPFRGEVWVEPDGSLAHRGVASADGKFSRASTASPTGRWTRRT